MGSHATMVTIKPEKNKTALLLCCGTTSAGFLRSIVTVLSTPPQENKQAVLMRKVKRDKSGVCSLFVELEGDIGYCTGT